MRDKRGGVVEIGVKTRVCLWEDKVCGSER